MDRTPPLLLLCVGLDPFLLRMVRTVIPGAVVRTAEGPDELLMELCREPDVIVQAATDEATEVGDEFADRLVSITDPRVPRDGAPNGIVLARPVDHRQLRLAIAQASGTKGQLADRVGSRVRSLDLSWSAERLFALVRLGLALVVAVDVTVSDSFVVGAPGKRAAVLVLLVAVLGHAVWRTHHHWLQTHFLVEDAALALALAAVTEPQPSPAILLLVLVAAEFGLLGTLGGVAGVIGVAGALAALAVTGDVPVIVGLSTVALGLAAGQLGAGLGQIVLNRRRRQRRLLMDVHTALEDLHEHARSNPLRLHASTLRADILRLVADVLDADRIALACGPPESWHRPLVRGVPGGGVVVTGDVPHEVRLLRAASRVPAGPLADLVAGGHRVLAAPLLFDGLGLGVLVAAWDRSLSPAEQRDRLVLLDELAVDAAVALDNADLFNAIDELSVSGERHRIARDLHDGVVQSFVHVGLELDRLADELADADLPSAVKVLRLRNVVQGAVVDARGVIGRLRLRNLDGGLRAALAAHLDELRTPNGPELVLHWQGAGDVATELTADLFRLVQEGVANARQHAAAETIAVSVARVGEGVEVSVEDDGDGFSDTVAAPLRGRGLPDMRERIEMLGGRLEIRSRPGTGTTVRATVPGAWANQPEDSFTPAHVPQESLR